MLIVARASAGAGILNSVSKMMVFARMVAIFFVIREVQKKKSGRKKWHDVR